MGTLNMLGCAFRLEGEQEVWESCRELRNC
jgi:hypothetical protein